MAFLENGNTVLSDTRDITVQYAVLTANNRVYVGASPNIPTSSTLGTVAMFFSGGLSNPSTFNTDIDKLPYASDTSPAVTNVGSSGPAPVAASYYNPGFSGPVSGYQISYVPANPTPTQFGIYKFPFAAPFATSTTPGAFLQNSTSRAGSNQSSTNGYKTGGGSNPAVPSGHWSSIQKFPFASETNNAISVGSLSITMRDFSSQESDTHGYTSGAYSSGRYMRQIEKYPFAADNNSVVVGALNYPGSAGREHNGLSSTTSGYCVSGTAAGVINKFPFATDNFIASVPGSITMPPAGGGYQRASGCSSSTTAGYMNSSQMPGNVVWNGILKLPFASDTGTTLLSATRYARAGAGHQSRV